MSEPLFDVNHEAILPGQTLKIQVPRKGSRPATLTWGEKTFPFLAAIGGFWRVLVPVPLSQESGKESLYITVNRFIRNDLLEGPLEVEILPSRFAKEKLEFSKNKSKLLNNPDEESESQFIREMIKAAIPDPQQRWRGIFKAPVPGIVLSAFGTTRNKIGQVAEDVHKGVDFAAKAGTSVLAPGGGLVLLVKEFNFHGKTVLLSHGQGVATIYLHLRSFNVAEGDTIQAGQKLGEVGATGLATGPHLHWGLYVQGQPVDPMHWLKEEF